MTDRLSTTDLPPDLRPSQAAPADLLLPTPAQAAQMEEAFVASAAGDAAYRDALLAAFKAADPLKLDALTRLAIRDATAAYLRGGSIDAWERAMRGIITRGHTAAALAGIAERSAGGRARAFLSRLVGERALSTAQRTALRQSIAKQFAFLDAFTDAVRGGSLSPAQIAARAELYAGATRATYYGARWSDWDLPFLPGDGATECRSNCRCTSEVEDLGGGRGLYYYRLGATERHCTTCPARAAGSPYTVRRIEG